MEYLFHRTRKSAAKEILNGGFKLKTTPSRRIEAGNGVYCFTNLEEANMSYPKKQYGNYIVRIGIEDVEFENGTKVAFMNATKEGIHRDRKYNVPYLGEVAVLVSIDRIKTVAVSKDNGKTWLQN